MIAGINDAPELLTALALEKEARKRGLTVGALVREILEEAS